MLFTPTLEPGHPPRTGHHAIQAVIDALRAGQLAVIPTETLYGLCADATHPGAVEHLRELTRAGDRTSVGDEPLTWHAPHADAVLDALEVPVPVQRRLLRRLLPGPVRFLIEQTPDRLAHVRRKLGVAPGVIDNGREVAIRVPDHPIALEVLMRVARPIVADRLGAAPGLAPDLGRTIGTLPPDIASIDAGPTRHGQPSTTVRLLRSGAFKVLREFAVDSATVMRAMTRTVLFVCSGNTCRSPMASALLRDALADRPEDGISTEVRSAGASAFGGSPASPEAIEAMARLGIDLTTHRSAALTRELVRNAERVYTMTEAHRLAVLTLDPTADDRVLPLDPEGDVPDPYGGDIDQYVQTAERLLRLVKSRLAELDKEL